MIFLDAVLSVWIQFYGKLSNITEDDERYKKDIHNEKIYIYIYIFTNKQKWKVWPFRNVGFVVLASTKFNPSSVCSDFSESQTG